MDCSPSQMNSTRPQYATNRGRTSVEYANSDRVGVNHIMYIKKKKKTSTMGFCKRVYILLFQHRYNISSYLMYYAGLTLENILWGNGVFIYLFHY